ncbi:MAG: cyanobacterial phytochrome A [Leptolyngbya sp. ERB_1_1]
MSEFESSKGDRSEVALEPVYISGSIQPYGILLALSEPELLVLQVSANVQECFKVTPQELLNHSLEMLLDAATIAEIRQELESLSPNGSSKLSLRIESRDRAFDGTVYRAESVLILELELAQPEIRHFQIHSRTKNAIAQLRQVSDLTEFLQAAAVEIHRMTDFDRVMVYQFDADGAGAVVAEVKRDNLPAYLGLHYPATDIPAPIRELYRQGLVRYIPDLSARSIELIPRDNPQTQKPLDLQLSILRSVDSCCVEYHHNMNVAAILVIALIQGEKLWGLISCHHQTPKLLAYEIRQSCELLGQLIASELANKVNTEELNYLMKLRSLSSEFVSSISQMDDLRQALINPVERLLDLVNAQGAAVCLNDEITLIGTTPSLQQVHALLQWTDAFIPAIPLPKNALFHTNALPKRYSGAETFKESASGLLLLQISKVPHYTILWFRPEVLQTVNWAGDPSSSFSVAADGGVTLCPRQSFEQWQEIVRSTSLPWKTGELENALDLRNAIVGIVLKKADELAKVNQELESSIQELDSFAYAASHDLKEPLRGIHNYSNLLLKGYSEVLDDTGRARLQTLIRLTRRMESLINALLRFSRLGQTEIRLQLTDLNQVVSQVLEDLPINRPELQAQIRIPRPLPTINCDTVLIQEVLVNLISNAVKYNDKPDQWVEIGFVEKPRNPALGNKKPTSSPRSPLPTTYVFYVRDNGIGIRERHLNSVFRLFKRLHEQHLYGGGTGAGLTIAKKIIERHRGQIWVESEYGKGSTFFFTLEES